MSTEQNDVAQRYADRIGELMGGVSDERARAFREVFSIAPWGDYSGGWDLQNIKQALAASDDPEIVGAIVGALEERECSS